MTRPARPLRIVMFVQNDVTRDSRVLREAATLAAAGHAVTVVGRLPRRSEPPVQEHERDGFRILRVVPPIAWESRWRWLTHPWRRRRWLVTRAKRSLTAPPPLVPVHLATTAALAAVTVALSLIRAPFYLRTRNRPEPPGGTTLDWLARWRGATLGWARQVAALAPDADVWHGHDLNALPAAVYAARARGGLVVYDSHEIFMDSGSNATRPWWARAFLRRYERRLARRAVALVTVNDALAGILGPRLGIRRTVVVHNAPARPTTPIAPNGRLRAATGTTPGDPLVLYHGGFSPHRGLEELAEAVLEPGLERVHAAFLGYGTLREQLAALATEPRFGGRVHVVDAVPPEELLGWVADADVAVMPIQASTLNHRLSTPNKLFESLAAGVPVVASDLPGMRPIVTGDPAGPLGELCDPTDPASIAAAIRRILDRPPEARAVLRERCRTAALERWNWETESARLVALYEELARELPSGAADA